ncbi:MAG TPA: HyaD/HybD family hydrogenase maturation endopeptidase, partial [Steroidobacteraceae bacterium]
TLILGIGNVLLSDDGAGVHVARCLARRLAGHDAVQVLDGGTLSFTLAPLIAGAQRLIILDATQLDGPPGHIQTFIGEGVDGLLGRARLTVHEIGLRDVLDLARLSGELPPERALIGIQPASLEWGTEPTPVVAEVLDSVAARALELLEHWPAPSHPAMRAA